MQRDWLFSWFNVVQSYKCTGYILQIKCKIFTSKPWEMLSLIDILFSYLLLGDLNKIESLFFVVYDWRKDVFENNF